MLVDSVFFVLPSRLHLHCSILKVLLSLRSAPPTTGEHTYQRRRSGALSRSTRRSSAADAIVAAGTPSRCHRATMWPLHAW